MSASATQRNRLKLLDTKTAGQLLVHEIYRSIQGESTFAGLPCVFVRLAVCDARCTWCDTPHAFGQGVAMSPEEVMQRVREFGCPLVEVTGGEPLLQPEVLPVMTALADAGHCVLLETSGAHAVSVVDPRVHIIMDLKCPGSGECPNNYWPNLGALKPTDQIKFVIASKADFEWAEQVIREHRLQERFIVLMSAVFGAVHPRELTEWLLACGLQNVRVQLQMHKYIWDPQARGV